MHRSSVPAVGCVCLCSNFRCKLLFKFVTFPPFSTLVAESKSSSPWASRRAATWPPWRTPSVIWLTRGRHLTQTWGWTDPDLLPQPQRAGEPLSVLPSELVLHPEASTGPGLSLWCLNPAWTLTVHREEHLLPPPQLHNHLSFQGIVTAWLYLGLSHLAALRISHSKLLPGLFSRIFFLKYVV